VIDKEQKNMGVAEQEVAEETAEAAQTKAMGIVRGVPGATVESVGVLDLRGVAPADLAALKGVKSTGVILIDSGQKTALSHVKMEAVGATVEIDPDEKLLMQPTLDMTKVALEAMAPGQKFTLMGILTFYPDVPAALVAEKFDQIRLIGVLIAPQAVQGALFGKLQHLGASITLSDEDRPLVRSMGDTTFTEGYLSHLTPGTQYVNVGHTGIADDVTEKTLANAIAIYHNVGATDGPAALIELLQARCPTNLGAFNKR
jgi:hypothetical protein